MTATDRSSASESAAPLDWHRVMAADELWEGDILDAEVGGEQVLLVSALGEPVRAFQGICPHQEILLVDGKWDEERGSLVCAGHAWEFDLRTGVGTNPAGCALYEFPVRIADGAIHVGVPRDGERHYRRCNGS